MKFYNSIITLSLTWCSSSAYVSRPSSITAFTAHSYNTQQPQPKPQSQYCQRSGLCSTIADNDMLQIEDLQSIGSSTAENTHNIFDIFNSQPGSSSSDDSIEHDASARNKEVENWTVDSTKQMQQQQLLQKGEGNEKEDQQTKRRVRASVRETGNDSMKYYLKTMGNHELLKKNEEIILAREIQILIKWEQQREELEAKLMRYVHIHHYCNYYYLTHLSTPSYK